MLTRIALLVLLPYIAGAVIPWLNPEASLRVALMALSWAIIANVFVLGFILGESTHFESGKANSEGEQKLALLSNTAIGVLALVALPVYFLIGSIWGLAVVIAAQWFNSKALRNTKWYQSLPPSQQQFLLRLLYMALGCWLMLMLSTYRVLSLASNSI